MLTEHPKLVLVTTLVSSDIEGLLSTAANKMRLQGQHRDRLASIAMAGGKARSGWPVSWCR